MPTLQIRKTRLRELGDVPRATGLEEADGDPSAGQPFLSPLSPQSPRCTPTIFKSSCERWASSTQAWASPPFPTPQPEGDILQSPGITPKGGKFPSPRDWDPVPSSVCSQTQKPFSLWGRPKCCAQASPCSPWPQVRGPHGAGPQGSRRMGRVE